MRFYKLFLLSILFMGSVVNHVYATDVNASNKNQVLFEQYRVEVYKGPIQIPSG